MVQVSVREARDNLSQLIKDVQAGEEIVIASHGRPVARLIPENGLPGAQLAALIRSNQVHGGRSRDEVDAYLAAERDSWE